LLGLKLKQKFLFTFNTCDCKGSLELAEKGRITFAQLNGVALLSFGGTGRITLDVNGDARECEANWLRGLGSGVEADILCMRFLGDEAGLGIMSRFFYFPSRCSDVGNRFQSGWR
jgi:hypothetical protein